MFTISMQAVAGLTVSRILKYLGTPVVPFCPFCFGVSLLKLNSGKKGTLIINGLLGNLGTRTLCRRTLLLAFAARSW